VAVGALGCETYGTIGATGSVGMALQLGPDVTVTSASYTVNGPDGFTTSGTVAVGSNTNVPIVLHDLPVGAGYVIDLSATASDGVTTCSGEAGFDVVDSASSTVIVHLVCRQPDTGNASIQGTANICPVLDGLGASPAEALVGGSMSLDALAHDSDDGPMPLTYAWSVGGVPVVGSGAHYVFTCNEAGVFDVAVEVSDGDPNPSCADNLSVRVTCTAP
jgi:hypothetical protein